MNAKLVGSMDAIAATRLATVSVKALLADVAKVLSGVIDEQSRPTGVVNARDALRTLLAQEKYEEALLRDYVMGIGYR